MTTNLPADVELSFPYRAMVDRLGPVVTGFVFQRLWSDLAFQTRVHGKSGVYEAKYIPKFEESIAKATTEGMAALLESGMLIKREDGDYLCRIFNSYNPQLDASYVPDTSKWARDWHEYRESMLERAPKLAAKIPQAAWYLTSGQVITEKTMNRAITTICSLDVILHRQNRKPEEMGIGMLQAACDLVTRYSDAKISAVLRRYMGMSRPRLNPLLPPTTEEALLHWDDLVAQIYPDEGFDNWIKRVNAEKTDEEENKDARADRITDELATALAGI